MALNVLPPVAVGVVLAGIFAATMSTADSLILSCAGSLSEDVARLPHNVWIAKLSTIVVCALALALALSSDNALGYRPSERLVLLMMICGVCAVYVWLQFDILRAYYEGAAAILTGFAVFGLGKLFGQAPAAERVAPAPTVSG